MRTLIAAALVMLASPMAGQAPGCPRTDLVRTGGESYTVWVGDSVAGTRSAMYKADADVAWLAPWFPTKLVRWTSVMETRGVVICGPPPGQAPPVSDTTFVYDTTFVDRPVPVVPDTLAIQGPGGLWVIAKQGDVWVIVSAPDTTTPPPPPGDGEAPVVVVGVQCFPTGECIFDGRGSTDNVGIASYSWNLNGVVPNRAEARFEVHFPFGSHTVSLTACDTAGNCATESRTFTHGGNQPPPPPPPPPPDTSVSGPPAAGMRFIPAERVTTWRAMKSANHRLWQEAVNVCALTGTSGERYGDRGVWCAVVAVVNDDAAAAAKAIAKARNTNAGAGANEMREDFLSRVLLLDLVGKWLTASDLAVIAPKLDQWAAHSPPQGSIRAEDSDAVVGEGCGALVWDRYNNRTPNRPFITQQLARYIGFSNGGQWPEGSQYNPGTLVLLGLCNMAHRAATGSDVVPGVSAFFAENATVAALEITPDFSQAVQWAASQYPRDFNGRLYRRVSLLGSLPGGHAAWTADELLSRYWRFSSAQLMEHALLLWRVDVTPTPLPNRMTHVAAGLGHIYLRDGQTLMWAMGKAGIGSIDHYDFAPLTNVQVYRNGWMLTNPIAYYGLMSNELAGNAPVYAGLQHFSEKRVVWTGEGNGWVGLSSMTRGTYFAITGFPPPPDFLRYGGRTQVLATVNGNPVVIVRDTVDMTDPRTLAQWPGGYRENPTYQHQSRITEFDGKAWSLWHMPVQPTVSGNALAWRAANGENVVLWTFASQPVQVATVNETSVFGGDVTAPEKKWQARLHTPAPVLWQVFTVAGESVSVSGNTVTVGGQSWVVTADGVTGP